MFTSITVPVFIHTRPELRQTTQYPSTLPNAEQCAQSDLKLAIRRARNGAVRP
jgi:hypothetical protein